MNIQQELSGSKSPFPLGKGWDGASSFGSGVQAIILAGGLGTRLRSAVPDLPKCMAPVAGQPFLYYVINYLRMQGIEKIIFSLGYMHEVILDWLQKEFPTLNYDYVIEEEPLGTGGAIQFALQKADTENVFIANGDTLFKFDAEAQLKQHLQTNVECTLALKPMQNFDRYGVVELNDNNIITSFKEKQHYDEGFINAGLYLVNKASFLKKDFTQKFSFEKDYLEKYVSDGLFSGIVTDSYFIDIGIPEDYNRAQTEFARQELDLNIIDKDWTLFLDRDGVINHDNPGGYITTPDEFQFTEDVPALFTKLNQKFKRIIVVTNQRGVGRGIIRHDDLIAMNEKMLEGVKNAGGDIEKIYFCTDIQDNAFYRKPNPGMAFQALKDFPDTDLSKSIIVGNSLSDMRFGRYAGMYTVFIASTNKSIRLPHADIDLIFDSLKSFSDALK
ncbi:HAD-IIIA family hydrolase [Niabella ginsengisoli]|uniref:HAD-IIIA family hydrolase n=1 Tax=Niabella ginsengisoli TaxID=522298 RepID=A0ABS9SH28_9BACT|nr:HAD-IIIA family hydrolase [Niabella ginsengisoli]MCH5597667.1 HAD-IIIA family hydrolase [Niabella ginsengisoli]